MRDAIMAASNNELCWEVRPERGGPPLTYLASQLQPSLTCGNADRLSHLVPQGGDVNPILRASILAPPERKRLIDAEIGRIAGEVPAIGQLFPAGPPLVRAGSHVQKLSGCFRTFQTPSFVVGDNAKVDPKGKQLWDGLVTRGLYRYEPSIGKDLCLRACLLSSAATSADKARADETLADIVSLLGMLGLRVDSPKKVPVFSSVPAALNSSDMKDAQAVIFFDADSGVPSAYGQLKRACLSRSAPGLAHLASQWMDVRNRDKHDYYARANMALALCAKLGHTPYVLDGPQSKQVLCGVDVCHYMDPQNHERVHLVAGLQLRSSNGEVEQGWLYQGRISGESIPAAVWRTVTSPEVCSGRQVVIHRDGRFTDEEKQFLPQHAKDVKAAGSGVALVEIVKYAGGTPRLYNGDSNPPPGAFMRLSDTEGILATSDHRGKGTRNPLLLRVAEGSRPIHIEEAAEDIFRMSLVNYSNLWCTARLPITTRAADAAAYFHASTGAGDQRSKEDVVSHGRQQYWL
eukprot:gnl/TRDRNA2_/TRDRNA2_84977_c1_seq1.p1 gnl/TRDRNA2_/TRDRNA2_84977_c1~~gnl/TRDRNA2_/TRDRNA2_84977_c1_seq1.p1  ORF type:complete len:600 (+),score=81.81 gnl/TRDRNA2_/TRDRNA2_84977_c1_seq1:251-1801(+)